MYTLKELSTVKYDGILKDSKGNSVIVPNKQMDGMTLDEVMVGANKIASRVAERAPLAFADSKAVVSSIMTQLQINGFADIHLSGASLRIQMEGIDS